MNNTSVIIVSAGKGTRMKSSISKPLHKVGNLELVNHVINTAKKLNCQEISVVVSEENCEEIRKNVDDNIKTVIQYDRLGTAHATSIGLSKIEHEENYVLIMYGDVPLIKAETYENMLTKLKNSNASLVVLGFNVSDIKQKYGRLIVKNNEELEKITEYKDATENERNIKLCNSGIIATKVSLLRELLKEVKNENASKEYYLTDIVEIARKKDLICNYVVAEEDEVMGVNSREDLSVAERIFQNNKRKEAMKNGVTLVDPNSVYFSYDTEISNDVVIEPNVTFLPGVKIDSNVTIKSFSYLESCEIKSGCSIGPFARIRPNTILNENVHIGNFVEIKKSNIENGVKIGHLTYIGDSEIGENTNIGGGTVTCNYNGYTKSKTKIGKNCFVGSNTIFIAPVEIGENTFTGAGSVITKNVDDNDLAITRAEQKNVKNGSTRLRDKYKRLKDTTNK